MGPILNELFQLLFSQGGLLGACFVGSIVVNIVLFKQLTECLNARITDGKMLTEALGKSATTMEDIARSMDTRTKTLEDQGRLLSGLAMRLDHQEERVHDKLDALNEKLGDERCRWTEGRRID